MRENNIEHKKLAVGFSINTATIPQHLEEEFIKVCTYIKD
jgi:hypothetical protein